MNAYWTQFAATGNPNRDDLPAWPEFHPPADHHLNLGEPVTSGEGLHQAAGWLFRSFEMGRRAGTYSSYMAQTVSELPDLRGNLMHDLHTAVLMRAHGISRICTRDAGFRRFPFLTVVEPLGES